MQTLVPSNIACHSIPHVVRARKGIQLSFVLIEPVVFLQGPSTRRSVCENKATVVRGSLQMKITEPVKIKRICVYFRGQVYLELSIAGIAEKRDLITSGVIYVEKGNATQSGNINRTDISHIPYRSSAETERSQNVTRTVQTLCRDRSLPPAYHISSLRQPKLLEAVSKMTQRISDAGRRECHPDLLPAGDYMYSFEFLMHDSLPETLNTELITTRYYLEAVIEPSGPFSSKMVSQLDVPVVRLPAENSLELIEPIHCSRQWREQLYYDICILGKSFPLGSLIPIRVNLTPLADLECHWIRVYVFQHVQHWTKGQAARRLQLPTRKVLLFEKQAGLAGYSTYSGSTMWITTSKDKISSPGIQTANLLGEVLETSEIKLEVQLPRCSEMKTKDKQDCLHFSTKVDSSEVNHWIQIVLCISMQEKDGMQSKPKPEEVTMNAPFTILSCKATPANIYVPPYEVDHDVRVTPSRVGQCGCDGSIRSMSLASRHEPEAPETGQKHKFKLDRVQSVRDITQSLSFDSDSNGIRLPPRAYLPS